MITDPKVRKFVDFYLAELLLHVKSMSEHRFSPQEYHLIKKLIVFITQSPDHISKVEMLASVTTLSPFYAFLQKIIEKVQQSDFKKSQMISVIETDSEKLSQIFSQILKVKDKLSLMGSELAKIGLEIDADALIREPAKSETVPSEKVVKKTTEEKKPVVPAETPPVKQTAPQPKPQILSASEFKKVDDMIGFLSKRKKRPASENQAPVEDTAKPAADTVISGTVEGGASDAEDFFAEFRTEFKRLESALSQLRTNLGRTRYIVEMADSFGEFKRIGKIFELPRFTRMMQAMEKMLIDVVDNAEGNKTVITQAGFGVIQQLAVLFKEIELRHAFPFSSPLLTDMGNIIESFEHAVKDSKKTEIEESIANERVAEVDEQWSQSAKDDAEEKSVKLNTSGLSADDFQVFKDEAVYTFETVQTAVRKLKASGSDPDSIKDLQQSFRSLFTGSRLLRFTELTGHFDLILGRLKTCMDSQNAIAPELLHLIEETVKSSALLIQGEEIPESGWRQVKTRLEKFGSQKELPSGDTPVEFKGGAARSAPVDKTAKKEMPPVSDTVLASNENWIQGFQSILESHPFALKKTEEEIPVESTKTPEVKPRDTQIPLPESVKPAATEAIAAPKTKLVRLPKEKEKTDESDRVTIPTNLVDLMAKGDVDLSDLELPSFVEKLNIEPQDIVKTKVKSVKKKKADKKEAPKATQEIKSDGIKASDRSVKEPVMPAKSAGGFVLEESNFESVDTEILDIFNQEAEGYFKILDKSLAKLDAQITDESALKDIERVSHSLKSSSRMLGLSKVSGLAGVIELIAERCNEKELEMSDELKNIMRSVVSHITQLLNRKPAEIAPILAYLVGLEAKLSAPNIFIGNIPGATAFVSSKEPGALQNEKKVTPQPTEEKIVAEKAKEPAASPDVEKKPAKTEPVMEMKVESKENYFAKIGVDEEIVEIFKEEATTYFKLITNSLAALRDNAAHETAMRDIEKSAHSLRSSAKMLGFQKIGNVVRPIESVAERINAGTLALDARILDLFTVAVKALQQLGEGVDVDITEIVEQLTLAEKQPAQTVMLGQLKPDASQVFERIQTQLGGKPKEEKNMQKQKASATPAKTAKKKGKSQSGYFSDIPFSADPILKNLNKGADELLEEMSHSSTQ